MPTKPEPPQIESIPFKDIIIDPLYSGRTKKEISANAKDLAPMLADGWDPAQPGQYFIGEDGKKVLKAGFTRMEAAKLNDIKSGYFIHAPGDAVTHLTACLRTNSGKAIARRAKGDVFVKLRDGVVADDFAGALADPKNAKDWKRAPMSLQEIADLPGVGMTSEGVRQCIIIAESSPEVAELMEADLVSDGIVVDSKQLAKGDDDKQLRILKKCISIAKADGKDKATAQHFKQAKAELFPPKLIADDGNDTPKSITHRDKEAGKPEKDAGGTPESGNQASGEPSNGAESHEETPLEQTLFNDAVQLVAKKDPKAALMSIIERFCEETSNVWNPDEMEQLADAIIEAKLPI